MRRKLFLAGVTLALATAGLGLRAADDSGEKKAWTDTFGVEPGELTSTGRNPYFVLEPGYVLEFEGTEKGKKGTLTITVLDETLPVDGVETRVVEERESLDGAVVEVSRNFFAVSKRTDAVYYFGEDVDIYKNGKVVAHEGAWRSGVDGARFGLAIPGQALLGARYYQEVAPGKAMDRAEVVGLAETVATPAGTFKNVLKTEETTPLEPDNTEAKYYAPGVGLIKDGPMKLTRAGFLRK